MKTRSSCFVFVVLYCFDFLLLNLSYSAWLYIGELQSRREFLKTSCDANVTSSMARDILPLDSQAMTGLYADSDDISICVRLIGER